MPNRSNDGPLCWTNTSTITPPSNCRHCTRCNILYSNFITRKVDIQSVHACSYNIFITRKVDIQSVHACSYNILVNEPIIRLARESQTFQYFSIIIGYWSPSDKRFHSGTKVTSYIIRIFDFVDACFITVLRIWTVQRTSISDPVFCVLPALTDFLNSLLILCMCSERELIK